MPEPIFFEHKYNSIKAVQLFSDILKYDILKPNPEQIKSLFHILFTLLTFPSLLKGKDWALRKTTTSKLFIDNVKKTKKSIM